MSYGAFCLDRLNWDPQAYRKYRDESWGALTKEQKDALKWEIRFFNMITNFFIGSSTCNGKGQ